MMDLRRLAVAHRIKFKLCILMHELIIGQIPHTLEIVSFRFLRCKAVNVYVLLQLDYIKFLSPERSLFVVLSR